MATSEGVLVFDALDSEVIARAQRQAIATVIKQPIRYLVSSPFHDPFSKGNLASIELPQPPAATEFTICPLFIKISPRVALPSGASSREGRLKCRSPISLANGR